VNDLYGIAVYLGNVKDLILKRGNSVEIGVYILKMSVKIFYHWYLMICC